MKIILTVCSILSLCDLLNRFKYLEMFTLCYCYVVCFSNENCPICILSVYYKMCSLFILQTPQNIALPTTDGRYHINLDVPSGGMYRLKCEYPVFVTQITKSQDQILLYKVTVLSRLFVEYMSACASHTNNIRSCPLIT